MKKKLKKVFDQTYKKGVHYDDSVMLASMSVLNKISHKPETEEELELTNTTIGHLSYCSIYDKKFRIVIYIEE